jgi:hypothetical protein
MQSALAEDRDTSAKLQHYEYQYMQTLQDNIINNQLVADSRALSTLQRYI